MRRDENSESNEVNSRKIWRLCMEALKYDGGVNSIKYDIGEVNIIKVRSTVAVRITKRMKIVL